jgi:hypothetical protein
VARARAWRNSALALASALLALAARPAEAGALLRPMVAARGSYGETYTFIADLEDGGYLHLSLGLTTLGPGSIKGICRAVVVGPDGPAWKGSDRVGRDGWRWEGGATERLAIGRCSAWTGADGGGVEVEVDGGRVRLEFARPLSERVPPEATLPVGKDLYRTSILLSRAPVSGTVALPGQPPRAVAGAAFADHSRSTVKPRDLARRWVRFRALRADRGLLLLGREGHDGRFTPAWACGDPGPCRRFPSFRIERSAHSAPEFRVALAADEAPLEIASGRLIFRDAPVEELGLLGKAVAPFVGNPVTYVYRAQLTGDGAPLDGILEVELDEE